MVPFVAECTCGWSTSRDRHAANLPEEDNERIIRTVASAHANRPRFGDVETETHDTTVFYDPDGGAPDDE